MPLQIRIRIAEDDPLPLAKGRLFPRALLCLDFHEVHRDRERSIPLLILIPSERSAEHSSGQAGFFPGFVERRLLRRITPIDQALGDPPGLATAPADHADLHLAAAKSNGDGGGLVRPVPMCSRHAVAVMRPRASSPSLPPASSP